MATLPGRLRLCLIMGVPHAGMWSCSMEAPEQLGVAKSSVKGDLSVWQVELRLALGGVASLGSLWGVPTCPVLV